jgi:hypothetical protein
MKIKYSLPKAQPAVSPEACMRLLTEFARILARQAAAEFVGVAVASPEPEPE